MIRLDNLFFVILFVASPNQHGQLTWQGIPLPTGVVWCKSPRKKYYRGK